MKYVERYVYDVVRRLPEWQRDDVAKELEAEIEAMVEGVSKGKPTKKAIFSVLQELGSPAQLADQYRERPRYLISPRHFDSYTSLLGTLFAVVLPILTFFLVISQISQVSTMALLFNALGAAIEVGIHIAFWTTLVYIFIDRYTTANDTALTDTWTPEQLPQLPPRQQITRREAFIGIAWSVFGVIITLTQLPVVHAIIQPNTPLFFAPEILPWWLLGLLGISLLSVLVELLKLRLRGWTKPMVVAITAANTITIAFFLAAITFVHPIANPEFTNLIQQNFGGSGVHEAIEGGIRLFVAVLVAVCTWEIIGAWMKYKKSKERNT